jgi:iron complex transport system ATP-binding protein
MNCAEAIRIENLAVGYRRSRGTKVIARGLNASIPGGGLTCLLGRNGVGKSTLLRTLSAFLPALEGEIFLLGRPLGSYSIKELSRTIGVVLTEKSELTNMTVRELVGMGRNPYLGFWGRLTKKDYAQVDKAIALVGIEALRGRMIQTLSDGERQKVMIAKALAQQTPVIFLDEPTAFLDFPSKVETMRLLRRLTRETGTTIFLSTHDLELALQMADRLCLMKDGLRVGTLDALSADGTMERFFADRGITFDAAQRAYLIDKL